MVLALGLISILSLYMLDIKKRKIAYEDLLDVQKAVGSLCVVS